MSARARWDMLLPCSSAIAVLGDDVMHIPPGGGDRGARWSSVGMILETHPSWAVEGMAMMGLPPFERAGPAHEIDVPAKTGEELVPSWSAQTWPVRSTCRAELMEIISPGAR